MPATPTPSPVRPLRLLLVRTGAMGDILHALPAVTAWRERHPEALLGWAVEPHWSPLLVPGAPETTGAAPSLLDRVHLVPTREWKQSPLAPSTLASIVRLRRELRAVRYDAAVDLQGSIRSSVLCRLSGAPRIVGSATPREPQARALYSETVPRHARHVIGQACELLAALDGKPIEPAPVELPRDPAAEAWFASRFGEDMGDPGAGRRPAHLRLVLLVPTAGWGAKQWPAEHFRALAAGLAAQGVRVLVNALSAADPVAAAITADTAAEPVVCSIAELIALIRRAALVIGGDTGPVHLAAALARPVIALFGPTAPERNGPSFPGAAAHILRSPLSATDHRRLKETEPGLRAVDPARVLELALRVLQQQEAEPVLPPAPPSEAKEEHG